MTSRTLNIDGQFIYIPGCMIASFGDSTTHTSEMQLVRVVQGVNLTKLHAVHQIYKSVIHLHTKLDVASDQIDQLLRKKNLYPPWVCVLILHFRALLLDRLVSVLHGWICHFVFSSGALLGYCKSLWLPAQVFTITYLKSVHPSLFHF